MMFCIYDGTVGRFDAENVFNSHKIIFASQKNNNIKYWNIFKLKMSQDKLCVWWRRWNGPNWVKYVSFEHFMNSRRRQSFCKNELWLYLFDIKYFECSFKKMNHVFNCKRALYRVSCYLKIKLYKNNTSKISYIIKI